MKKRVLVVSAIVFVLISLAVMVYLDIPVFVCVLHKFTGLYCPGCGGTRAVKSLLHGNFRLAFHCNPVTVTLLPFIAYYIVRKAVFYILGKQDNLEERLPKKLILAVAVIVIAFGVLRNIPVYPFTLLQPPLV